MLPAGLYRLKKLAIRAYTTRTWPDRHLILNAWSRPHAHTAIVCLTSCIRQQLTWPLFRNCTPPRISQRGRCEGRPRWWASRPAARARRGRAGLLSRARGHARLRGLAASISRPARKAPFRAPPPIEGPRGRSRRAGQRPISVTYNDVYIDKFSPSSKFMGDVCGPST